MALATLEEYVLGLIYLQGALTCLILVSSNEITNLKLSSILQRINVSLLDVQQRLSGLSIAKLTNNLSLTNAMEEYTYCGAPSSGDAYVPTY